MNDATRNDPIHITIYGNAEPAGSKTSGQAKNGRRYIRDSNPRAAEWKRVVSQAAGAAMHDRPLLAGPLELTLTIYRQRPTGHYGKRGLRPSAPTYPTTRPDATKCLRAVEDALTGTCWIDDAQIITQHVHKRYGAPVRVELVIQPVPAPSVDQQAAA